MKNAKLIGTIVLAGALLVAHRPASAQTVGLKAGPTFSKVDVQGDNTPIKYLTSFGGGGFVRFGMMGLGMQGEILALTKGAKIEDGANHAETKITYIEVPVLARFGLGTGNMAPYLMVGPSFAFEISCNGSFTISGVTQSDKCESGGQNSMRRKFDLGATGVAGLEFRMGPGALLIEGRYTHGLTNLNKDTSFGNDQKVRNRSWAAMAGYAFSLMR